MRESARSNVPPFIIAGFMSVLGYLMIKQFNLLLNRDFLSIVSLYYPGISLGIIEFIVLLTVEKLRYKRNKARKVRFYFSLDLHVILQFIPLIIATILRDFDLIKNAIITYNVYSGLIFLVIVIVQIINKRFYRWIDVTYYRLKFTRK